MTRTAPRVLIVQYSSNRDGSSFSGLLLADGLREAGWDTHVVFGFEGPIIERYIASGHETYVTPHKNWLRRGRSHQFAKDVWLEWRKAKAFEALLDEVSPDVVYLNTVVSLAGAAAAYRQRIPCVWHLREMFADIGGEMHAPQWARPLVRWLIFYLADRLVANSKATARNILGRKSASVPIVPNAVRSVFFEDGIDRRAVRDRLGMPADGWVIGVPGTLRPMKGHPFFFRAVAPFLHAHSNAIVAVTGGGEIGYAKALRAQVRKLGIARQVRFLGWVEDMPSFYRACDVCCIPSRAEPFGRTVIEAFASGTPVVATAVGGIREIIENGATGLLAPYDDEESLREAIRTLLETSELRQKMSRRARIVAEKEYHERVYKQRLCNLVQGVTADGHHL